MEKMVIKAYTDNKYGTEKAECTVKINPASYTHNFQVNYDKTTALGKPGTPLEFKGIPPQTVSFEVYFDSTGAVEGSKVPVKDQLSVFKKVAFVFNGDIHEPNYLIISWGALVFRCKLTSLSVNYTLFKQDGTPLRAKASMSFEQAVDADLIAKDANPKSPDLTHLITVKQGDTLPVICYRTYGDSSYYWEVAKYNNIANFQNLKPGTKLYLPPIK